MEFFDNPLTALQNLLQFTGQTDIWLPMVFVFATIILVSVGLISLFRPTAVVARRMKGTASREEISQSIKKISLRNDSSSNKALDQILVRLEKYLVKSDEKETTKLRERLPNFLSNSPYANGTKKARLSFGILV